MNALLSFLFLVNVLSVSASNGNMPQYIEGGFMVFSKIHNPHWNISDQISWLHSRIFSGGDGGGGGVIREKK